MNLTKLNSFKDYQRYKKDNVSTIQVLLDLESKITKQLNQQTKTYIKGFSWTAQTESRFLVDLKYSNSGQINFRERLICDETKLNNRIRGCVHVFEEVFKPKITDAIYLTEQCSLLAKWLRKKYSNISGSEYIKDCSWYYKLRLNLRLFPEKLVHQDLTQLSYPDNAYEYILTFDCLEHIPDYKQALSETYRTLNNEGRLLLSVPFDVNNPNNLIRATVDNNGDISHIEYPEYHGDPVSGQGCLSYYTFGWELLNELRTVGFKKVYVILYWSKKYCYLGGEQIIICAEK